MRWLILTNHFYDVGGLQSRTKEICKELLTRGEDIEFWCFDKNPYSSLTREFPGKCKTIYFENKNTRKVSIHSLLKAIAELKQVKPDYLFFCIAGTPDFLPYIFAAKIVGVKKIITHAGANAYIPGVNTHERISMKGLGKWWWRFWAFTVIACNCIDIAFFNNQQQKENFIKLFKFYRAKKLLWWPPVDLNKFKPDKEKRISVRNEFELNGCFVFGAVGNLSTQKRYDILIDAFAKLKHQYSDNDNIRLIIIGEGKLEKDLRERCKTLCLEKYVCFLGKRYDVYRIFNGMDTFVLASADKNETLGIVILESMASGVPCIVTNLPGPMRVVNGGMCGIVCEAGDVESLYEAMNKIFHDEKIRNHFIEKGLQRSKLCELKDVVDNFLQIINE